MTPKILLIKDWYFLKNYQIILLGVILCIWLNCGYLIYHNNNFPPIFFSKLTMKPKPERKGT